MYLYIGPGIGAVTIVIVVVILLIVLASLAIVFSRPLKKLFGKGKKPKDDA